MKAALLSLPRSRSECMFESLASGPLTTGMEIYRPTAGNYYYIDNDEIKPNMFCKIDARTPLDRFKRIVEEFNDHTWYVTTRKFEDFCLSFACAQKRKQFHDFKQEEYKPFRISKSQYEYCRDMYKKFEEMVAMLPNKCIMDYDEIVPAGKTVHNEKDYKSLCLNYEEFRDWQRVDYIWDLKRVRKWSCWTSWDTRGELQKHELFSDIAGDSCQMWFNIYEQGDGQDWHTHDGVKGCGTRVLQQPINSGYIEFEDSAITCAEHETIYFGPFDKHRVTTNESGRPRITVSWNSGW